MPNTSLPGRPLARVKPMPTELFDPTLPCKSVDPDVFFPKLETGEPVSDARRICASCPRSAQIACFRAAMDDRWCKGIWAGTTTAQRDALRKRRIKRVTV